MKLKKLIPSSLLGRSLIIVFVPTIAVVLLTAIVFYETSWNIISKRLTQSVAADIKVIIKLIDQDLKFKAFRIANDDFKMKVSLKKNIDNLKLITDKKKNDVLIYIAGLLAKRDLKKKITKIY